jgi:BirA family biotin operon repressor/biotin-[acetyl-CoA-carboxylase] ligase
MNLESLRPLVARIDYADATGSTNVDVAEAALADAQAWPDLSVLAAGEQTAGRGRSGRQWQSLPGASLSVSVLVRPKLVAIEHYGWLPILAGLAMTRAVAKLLPTSEVSLKWPNDVLVGDKKICGVLSELLSDASGVVIGVGLNLTQSQGDLPIANATSLRLEGATVSFEAALEGFLVEFVALYTDFVNHRGDADASGLRLGASAKCSSIGRRVRVLLPGDQQIEGKGIELDQSGRILVAIDGEHQLYAVAAGDIVHLRHN